MLKGWNKQEWSWAFYDWANSAYALLVMTTFFPLLLKSHIDVEGGTRSTTALLGYASSIASAAVVVLSPLLGAVADQFGAKKKMLLGMVFVGVTGTAAIAWAPLGSSMIAVSFFVIANIGFSGANGLYDSLLLSVTGSKKLDRLSALGFSLGYAGSLVIFVVAVAVFMKPDLLGISDKANASRIIIGAVAGWWLLFSIPIWRWVKETPALGQSGQSLAQAVSNALLEIKDTFREIKVYPQVGTFLLAYWLYIDGVYTVIKMAMAYSTDLGFKPEVSIIAILLTNFIAVPATLAYAGFAEKIGIKNAILAGLVAYLVVTAGAPFMTRPAHFFILAGVIGLAQGGVQAMSRSLFARLIPEGESGKYYGIYNMVGKFAAVMGPALMATLAIVAGDRLSILVIPVLLIAGMWILTKVSEPGLAR